MLEVSKLQEDSRLKDSFLRSHSIDYPTSTRKQREAKLLGHPADKRSSLHFARSNYIRSVFCKQLAYFFRYRASLRLRAESIRPGNNLATYCYKLSCRNNMQAESLKKKKKQAKKEYRKREGKTISAFARDCITRDNWELFKET